MFSLLLWRDEAALAYCWSLEVRAVQQQRYTDICIVIDTSETSINYSWQYWVQKKLGRLSSCIAFHSVHKH